MKTRFIASLWIVLLSSTLLYSFSWAGPGADSIQLPSLKTDGEKLAFLIEIKHKLPKLFSDAASYDINLFSLLDDEAQLLTKLKSNPKYLQEFENKTYDEITVTPPLGGLEVGTKKIKLEAIQQWKSQLSQSLQELKRELKDERGGLSPEKVVNSQINGIFGSLEDSGNLQNLSGKKFGRLLAEFGKEKQNQALFNEKIGKAKDLDLKGRLILVLELYDQFPVKPHTVTKGHLEHAIQFLSEVEELIALSTLQVVLHRPGQAENADGKPWESWKAAEESLNQLNGQDLEYFLDKQDTLAPLVRNSISSQISTLSTHPALESELIEAIFKRVDSYAQQTEGEIQKATEKIRLTQVPPAMGIFRGCPGGDCSSQYSFPYPNDPHERVFFIYDSKDQLKGYVSSTEVVAQGERALYIITISGKRVNAADTELILRALDRKKEQLGVKNILLPEPSKVDGLINFQEIRGVYETYTRKRPVIPIHYQDPDLRSIIEGYQDTPFNSGSYDHMKNNQHGVVLKFSDQKSNQLSVEHERLFETRILPKSFKEIQSSDIVEFLLDLNKSGRSKIVQKVTQIREVQSKINLSHFSELTDHLLKKCEEEAGTPLSVQSYRHQVQTLFSQMGMDSNYLENHLSLLYPGIVHCQDSYLDQNINLISELIIKHIKENLAVNSITVPYLKDSDKKAISQSAPFLKYYEKLVQQIKDPNPTVYVNAVDGLGALAAVGEIHPAIAPTLAERMTDPHPMVRGMVIFTLGEIKPSDPMIAHALVECLKDPDVGVQVEAARALGKIKPDDPEITHALTQLLLADRREWSSASLQTEAAITLGKINLNALAQYLKDPHRNVRRSVVYALGEIEPSDPAIHRILIKHLKDPDWFVQKQAANALKRIKPSDPMISQALVELFKKGAVDLHITCDLFAVLYPAGLVECLKSPGWKSAAEWFEKIKPIDPAIVHTVAELLKVPHWQIRSAAAYALGKIKPNDPAINQILAKLLKEDTREVRISVAYALAEISPDDSEIHRALVGSVNDLIKALKTNVSGYSGLFNQIFNPFLLSHEFREIAKEALIAIKPNDPKVYFALIEMLQHQNSNYVRSSAEDVLIKLRPTHDDVYLKFLEMSKSELEGLPYAAERILKKWEADPMVRKTILNHLIFAFHDADMEKRTKILNAVKRLHDLDPTQLEEFAQGAKRTVEACKISNQNLKECQYLESLSDITHKLSLVW